MFQFDAIDYFEAGNLHKNEYLDRPKLGGYQKSDHH